MPASFRCALIAAIAVFALAVAVPVSAQSFDDLASEFETYKSSFKGYGDDGFFPFCASGAAAVGAFAPANVGDTVLLGLLAGVLLLSRARRDV